MVTAKISTATTPSTDIAQKMGYGVPAKFGNGQAGGRQREAEAQHAQRSPGPSGG
ncbi:hypothetical protein [Deinococcus roseus]|uniref:hypothetical protein n=1 Tax=Deinococcus roseus TaxID=392414 RepID=UPI00166D9181|nr:hypothetical protein [Deinococcus roseus]